MPRSRIGDQVYRDVSGVRNMTKRDHNVGVLFLCDRRKCGTCHPEVCKHTTDIRHAVNFTKAEGFWLEREDDDKARS